MAKKKHSTPLYKLFLGIILLVFIGIIYFFFNSHIKPSVLWKYHNTGLVGQTQIIYKNKIFTEVLDDDVIALNLNSGKEVWKNM